MLRRLLGFVIVAVVAVAAEPVRVNCRTARMKLRQQLPPLYPPGAQKNHPSARVKLEAIIAVDGRVKTLKVLKGKGPFSDAACEAVRQWVYEPTLLNGKPVEVITTILVRFEPGP